MGANNERNSRFFAAPMKKFIARIFNTYKVGAGRSSTATMKASESLLDALDSRFRTPLLSMYRGEPQLGIDGQTHAIDKSTKISPSQGIWLYNLCVSIKPKATLEIGMAYGYSTLYILAGVCKNKAGRHTAVDPFQRSHWLGVGLVHVQALASAGGYAADFSLIEELSDRAAIDLARSS